MAKLPQSGSRRNHDSLISHLYPSRRSALSLAIAIALGLPGAAMAQQEEVPQESAAAAGEAQLEEVIVTGIRAGIQDAIQVKADLQSISEVISAEDIGKLPDTSIADAISRMPGITTQRAEGRASAISLRGTDPGFTTGLMNGREQVSTGDNRAIEYDQYPAELINSVVIYKTPDAQVIGQGLAGTIDLRTIRPLDYGQQAVILNLRGEYNSNNNLGANADDQGYRASFSYVDQFMDGKLGVAIGYARLDSPMATKGFGTYEPWRPNGTTSPAVPPDLYVTEGMKVRTEMGNTVRDGYLGTVEFRPNDTYGTVLDFYYTSMDQIDNARMLEVNLNNYPSAPTGQPRVFSDAVARGDSVVGGNINNVVPMVRNYRFTTDDEILATGWLNEFQLSDAWKMLVDVSYSKATRDQYQPETNAALVAPAGQPWAFDNGSFNLKKDGWSKMSFDFDYADPATLRIGSTPYGAGYSKKPHVEDELTAGRIIAEREGEYWWFNNFSFGLNYGDRTKDKESPEGNISTGPGDPKIGIPARFLLPNANLNYGGAGKVLSWNVKGLLENVYAPVDYGGPEEKPYLTPKYWTVQEEVWTGFLRGDLDHVLSDNVTLKGNVGLQIISTDQSSTAYRAINSYTPSQEILRYEDGTSYTDWLPQINLIFELPDQQAVRFGFSQQMARARMDQLKATNEVNYNQNGTPSGNGGNPNLDPWRAWAYDLAYEKYFADYKGYFSAATFYKDLTSYIYVQTDGNYDFSSALDELPPNYFPPGVVPKTTGNFSLPVNGQGGYLYGLELALSVPFGEFSEWLDGFGATVSYAYTDSDIQIEGVINNAQKDNIPLPGLSENVFNWTLYYEKYGFGARVASRYRSEYIGEVTNFANDRTLRYVDSGTITDAQVSYTFENGGMLEGLMLLFQVNNLTNEPYVAYVEKPARLLDYQEYGTVYLFGANYRF